MKKSIYITLLLVYNTLMFSQQGEIIYAVKFDTDVSKAKEQFQANIKSISTHVNLQKFQLNFKSQTSVFKNITNSTNDNKVSSDDKIAGILTSNGIIYFDSKSLITIDKKEDGILIKSTTKQTDWEITKETKKIEKYTCYKALKKTSFLNRKGELKSKMTIAWFTPELPFSFGPKNYFGLPGLILEVEESNKLIYYATSINLSKKVNKIELPKGKSITQEEYDNRIKAQMGL